MNRILKLIAFIGMSREDKRMYREWLEHPDPEFSDPKEILTSSAVSRIAIAISILSLSAQILLALLRQ